jgi:hypothetical protein
LKPRVNDCFATSGLHIPSSQTRVAPLCLRRGHTGPGPARQALLGTPPDNATRPRRRGLMPDVGRTSAAEKVRRDTKIVADRARGFRWAAIARRHGLSERQCRQVWREHRATEPPLAELDPLEILAEAVEQHDALVSDLAELAERANQPAVTLGVLKLKLRSIDQRLLLLQGVGLLPQNLGAFRAEIDVRRVAAALIDAFERHQIPEAVENDVLDILKQVSFSQNGLSRHS